MTEQVTDGLVRLSELAAKANRLIGVHLQVADRCNHVCQHCYQVQGEKGELSLEQIRGVLDDLAASGILFLNISGGEATLRSDLPEILAHARLKGFATRLYTNGYTIDDTMADMIAGAGLLEVHISVYSDVESEHDSVTGVQGSLRRTMAGIERLRARRVPVVMKSPILNVGHGQGERLKAVAARLGCSLRLSTEVTPREDGSMQSKVVETTPEDLLSAGAIAPWSPGPDDASLRDRKLSHGSCGVCRSGVTVLSNGEVRPCTDTIVPLGNLTSQKFSKIVDENPVVPFLRSITWNDIHGCRDCDLLLACNRCHASAAHEGRDYLGPYESACAIGRTRYAGGVGGAKVLDPASGCSADRSRMVGPYRIEEPGILRPIPNRESALDLARAKAFPWLRPEAPERSRMVAAASVDGMIQLRRSSDGPVISPNEGGTPGCV